ncbi:MAG TPA: hypothetical protein QGF35_03365 [Dehalococcoidia bacterium]|nr:hypothetical protein [Dehalococcoidia bacterium]
MTVIFDTDPTGLDAQITSHDPLEEVVGALRAAREVPFEAERPALWHKRFTARVTDALVAMRGHATNARTAAGSLRSECSTLVTKIDGLLASALSAQPRQVQVPQMVELSEQAVALELAGRDHARVAALCEEGAPGG